MLILIPGGRMPASTPLDEIFQGDNGLGIYIETRPTGTISPEPPDVK